MPLSGPSRLGSTLPCKELEGQVDYIFVGVEPSFSWADSIEHAKEKVACGFVNYWGYERTSSKLLPNKLKHRLRLFVDSICQFLKTAGNRRIARNYLSNQVFFARSRYNKIPVR